MKEKILQKFNLADDKIVNIYPYGSRVYGTAGYQSDYDYWVICKNNIYSNLFAEKRENISIHLYDENSFLEFLNQNKLGALECIYLPKEFLLKYTKTVNFTLDIEKVKANSKEKYERDCWQAELRFKNDDIFASKKALFHALRTSDFCKQIVKNHKIVSYNMQPLWNSVLDDSYDSWEQVKKKWVLKY
jgi:predicted nucleotidyltransferase